MSCGLLVLAAAVAPAAPPVALTADGAAGYHGAAASDSPDASQVAVEVLAGGGNAVDAAVAAGFVLMVAEPGGAGLAGDAYMLVHLVGVRTVAIDGASVVPASVDVARLRALDEAGRLFGPAAVAAPGAVAALAMALERYGTRAWAESLEPARQVAEAGFTLSPSQHAFLADYAWKIREDPYLAGILLGGRFSPPAPGGTLCNPDLARTLRSLQVRGPDEWYRGATARRLVADLQLRGGAVTLADLARVRAREREPVRGQFRALDVVSCPPPAGGAALVEALSILDALPPERMRAEGWERHATLIEAVRIANADTFGADVPLPLAAFRAGDRAWAVRRAALLRSDRALLDSEISQTRRRGLGGGTTHLSVVDAHGNAVALTLTLGRSFGSCSATPGLGVVHNGMLEPLAAGEASVAPSGLLPNPTAPTMLLRAGRAVLVLGGAGSERITSTVAVVVSNVVDRGLALAAAVSAPRVIWGERSGVRRVYVELAEPLGPDVADALVRRGYTDVFRLSFPPSPLDLAAFGGVNAVAVEPDGRTVAVGEPRRTGAACVAAP